jgi:hypothetical protein
LPHFPGVSGDKVLIKGINSVEIKVSFGWSIFPFLNTS